MFSKKVERQFRIISISIAFVLAFVTLFTPLNGTKVYAAEVQATYYVAPNGNDSNPGTLTEPFATLQKARDVVRTINGNMTGDIYVYLKQGDYYVNNTIQFNEQDSGTNGFKVYYKNYDAVGSARLIGGQKITGWTQYSGNIYKTNVGTGWKFNTLYENGKTAWQARYPNKQIGTRYTMSQGNYLRSEGVNGSSTILQYKSGDLNPTGWDLTDAQVYVWPGGNWAWFTDTVPISSIDTTKRQITLQQPTRYPLYQSGVGSRYYIQGALDLLDQPGEFYLNSATGELYYWAMDGDIQSQTIIAPKIQTIIELKGSSPSTRISNIVLEGFSFEVTEFTDWFRHGWINAGDSGETHQYPVYDREINLPKLRKGAVLLENSRYITIDKSHFKNIGLNAVFMLFANDHNTVSRSWFEHIGHSGIFLEGGYPGEGDNNNYHVLTNNKIEYVGEKVGHGSGVYVMNSSNNEVSYSEISYSPRYAVTWKSRWEPPSSEKYTKDNVFKYLKISNSAQDSGDTAPVYAVGINTANEFSNVNKVIQVTVNNTYADPSMTDSKPSGVFMDDKSNAQYFENVEVTNVQGTQLKNNASSGHTEINTSWKAGFDKSLMDYANIGLKSDFPVEYKGKEPEIADFSLIAPANHAADVNTMNALLQWQPATGGEGYELVVAEDEAFTRIVADVNVDGTSNAIDGLDPNTTYYWKVRSYSYSTSASAGKWSTDVYSFTTGTESSFFEDFENGFASWTAKKGTPSTSTAQARSGSQSYVQDEGEDFISRTFSNPMKGIVTVWYYDNVNGATKQMVNVNDTNNAALPWVAIGVDSEKSGGGTNYQARIDGTYYDTKIARTKAWHEFKWDYTGDHVKLYIDGTQIAISDPKLSDATMFNTIGMGDDWPTASGTGYFDDVAIKNITFFVSGVTISESSIEMKIGDTKALTAKVQPGLATNQNVSWASDDETVAVVDANGAVTAVGAGTATITVTTEEGSFSASSMIKVSNVFFSESFENGFGEWTVSKGTATTTSEQQHDGNLSYVINEQQDFIYKKFASAMKGIVTIWYYDNMNGGKKNLATVHNTEIQPSNTPWIAIGVDTEKTNGNTHYQYRLEGDYYATSISRSVGWHEFKWDYTGDHVKLYIDNEEINVTAEKAITAIEKAISFNTIGMGDDWPTTNSNGYYDDIKITDVIYNVSGVILLESDVVLDVGDTKQLTAKVEPIHATNKEMTWSSDDEAVAVVDADGVVTAVGAGEATITVTTVDGSRTATSAITVKEPTAVTGVTLSGMEVELEVGDSWTLVATVEPADAANKEVTWATSNEAVAKVNDSGVVTAVGTGNATITVTTEDGDYEATSEITVKEKQLVTIFTESFENGFSEWVAEKGKPSVTDLQAHDGKYSFYQDEDHDYISKTFTDSMKGIVTVWYYDNLSTSSKQLINVRDTAVLPWVAMGVETTKGSTGGATKYQARVDGTFYDTQITRTQGWHEFKWDYTGSHVKLSIDDQEVIINDPKLLYAATFNKIEMGDSWDTLSGTGYFDDITVMVAGIMATDVTLNVAEVEMEIGDTTALVATVAPANATNKAVTWTSSNTAVATVDASGAVTAVSAGTATITITTVDGGYKATATVTVTAKDPETPETVSVTGVTLDKSTLELEEGQNGTLAATVAPANATNKAVTWTSSNTAVATVDASGTVTAVSAGSAMITVTTVDGGRKATATITVTAKTPETVSVTGVTLDKSTLELEEGQNGTLTATVAPANATNKALNWTSSDEAIAKVNDSGLVTAVAAGTATITATTVDGNFNVESTVTVKKSVIPPTTDPTPTPEVTPKPTPEPTPGPTEKPNVFDEAAVDFAHWVEDLQSRVEAANATGQTAELQDVKGHWAEQAIGIFTELQFVNGYADGTFRPDGDITRAEFATLIYRIFGIKSETANVTALKDIEGHWAQEAIEQLAGAGIIFGYGDGSFQPERTISREELVVILSRILNAEQLEKDPAKGNFTDLDVAGSYAKEAIQLAVQAGLINGKGNSAFDPKGNSTRAEVVTILLRTMQLNPAVKELLEGLK